MSKSIFNIFGAFLAGLLFLGLPTFAEIVDPDNNVLPDSADMGDIDQSKTKIIDLKTRIAPGYASVSNAAMNAATAAQVSGKQDKLPYPTNQVPWAVIADKPVIPTVPTKVSEFENDAGYVTETDVSSTYATKEENAAKQDKLPYPTNSIPQGAVSGLATALNGKIDKDYGTANGSLTIVTDMGDEVTISDIAGTPGIRWNSSSLWFPGGSGTLAFQSDIPRDYAAVSNAAMTAHVDATNYTDSAVLAAATAATNYTDTKTATKQDKLPYPTNAIPQSAITGLSTSLDDKRDMTNLTYECISEQWDFSLWQAIVPGEYMIGDGQPSTIPFYYRANGTGIWSEAGYGFLSESGTEYTPSTTAEDFRQIEGVTITRAVRDTLALVSNIPTNVSAFNNDAGYVTTSTAAETYQPKGDYALASALAAAAAAATNHTDTAAAAAATASTNYTDAAVAAAATASTNYTDSAAVAAVSTAVSTSKDYTDASTNAVIQHVDAMDTSYYRFETITNVNQSVQYVATDANTTELRIQMPSSGMTKDWLVYIYPATNLNIVLPGPADYWCSSYDVTNAIPAGVPTALYFSQITEGVFSLGRKKLDCPITVSSPLTAKLRAAQAASRRAALSARRPTLTATALKTAAKPAATAAKPTAAAVKPATTNTTATATAPAKK